MMITSFAFFVTVPLRAQSRSIPWFHLLNFVYKFNLHTVNLPRAAVERTHQQPNVVFQPQTSELRSKNNACSASSTEITPRPPVVSRGPLHARTT